MGGRVVCLGHEVKGADVGEAAVEGVSEVEVGRVEVLLALGLRIMCSWCEVGPPSSNTMS
jgi:hypothetical protein